MKNKLIQDNIGISIYNNNKKKKDHKDDMNPMSIAPISINNDHINHNNDIQEIKRSIHSLSSQIQEIQINVDNIMTKIDKNYDEKLNDLNSNKLILEMLKEIKRDIFHLKNEEKIQKTKTK